MLITPEATACYCIANISALTSTLDILWKLHFRLLGSAFKDVYKTLYFLVKQLYIKE